MCLVTTIHVNRHRSVPVHYVHACSCFLYQADYNVHVPSIPHCNYSKKSQSHYEISNIAPDIVKSTKIIKNTHSYVTWKITKLMKSFQGFIQGVGTPQNLQKMLKVDHKSDADYDNLNFHVHHFLFRCSIGIHETNKFFVPPPKQNILYETLV